MMDNTLFWKIVFSHILNKPAKIDVICLLSNIEKLDYNILVFIFYEIVMQS